MAMEINGNYSSYATQPVMGNTAASNIKKKETENISQTTGSSKSKSTADYVNELAKLAPSVKFKVGYSLSTARSGKTLTINPRLLEKMQNDPEKEKEMKELIKGVEFAVKMIESINKASGRTVVYKHSYIDENGKYHSMGYYRNDFMLNMSRKLRIERKKNFEKLIQKTKKKAVQKTKKLAEKKKEHAQVGANVDLKI